MHIDLIHVWLLHTQPQVGNNAMKNAPCSMLIYCPQSRMEQGMLMPWGVPIIPCSPPLVFIYSRSYDSIVLFSPVHSTVIIRSPALESSTVKQEVVSNPRPPSRSLLVSSPTHEQFLDSDPLPEVESILPGAPLPSHSSAPLECLTPNAANAVLREESSDALEDPDDESPRACKSRKRGPGSGKIRPQLSLMEGIASASEGIEQEQKGEDLKEKEEVKKATVRMTKRPQQQKGNVPRPNKRGRRAGKRPSNSQM